MCPEEDGGCGGGGGGGVAGTGGPEAAVALDELRSWWEVPAIAHFCSLFRTAFRLPDFEIEVRAPRPPSPPRCAPRRAPAGRSRRSPRAVFVARHRPRCALPARRVPHAAPRVPQPR